MENLYWRIKAMTAISLYVGWRNGVELRSFQAVSLQNIQERLTGILTKNAIWWKISSSNSKTTAALPPDMRKKLFISRLLSTLPLSLSGYFDGFKTDSRTTSANVVIFLVIWYYSCHRRRRECEVIFLKIDFDRLLQNVLIKKMRSKNKKMWLKKFESQKSDSVFSK